MTATPMTTKLIDDMLHGAGIPRCDEWEKLVRHSRALETSVYRGISDLDRVEAERDALRAREKELVEALQVAEALRPKMLKDFGYVPEYVLDFCNNARALLSKVRGA